MLGVHPAWVTQSLSKIIGFLSPLRPGRSLASLTPKIQHRKQLKLQAVAAAKIIVTRYDAIQNASAGDSGFLLSSWELSCVCNSRACRAAYSMTCKQMVFNYLAVWVQVQEGHSTEETADKSAVASSSHESQDSPPETTSADGKDDAAISESRSQSLPLSLGSRQQKRLASSSPLAPIWTVQAQPVFFDAERPQAKELAKAFVAIQE